MGCPHRPLRLGGPARPVCSKVLFSKEIRFSFAGGTAIALTRFEEQAAAGTVQGPGTPAVAMYNAQGERVTPGSGGGGALGVPELITAVLLGLALLCGAVSGRRGTFP